MTQFDKYNAFVQLSLCFVFYPFKCINLSNHDSVQVVLKAVVFTLVRTINHSSDIYFVGFRC